MYAKRNYCPECDEKITSSTRRCKCGWRENGHNEKQGNFCRCGKETVIQNLCDECYEPFRPRTDVEIEFENGIKKIREEAISNGYVTDKEIADYSKSKLSKKVLNKLILGRELKQKEFLSDRRTYLELSPATKKLMKMLDANHAEEYVHDEQFFCTQ